ncbi:MAG: ATP-binding protein [Balneolales bacterium]|nr:ATP-binding protein [Balneolales bacterium]
MSKKWKLELETNLDQLDQVEELVNSISKHAHLSEDQYDALMLTASEAVTNAMKHGNKMDASKKVFVTASLDDTSIQVSGEDEGDGFDPDALPDPLDPANLLKTSGRGVFLMKTYCDGVAYSKGGRQVKLTFSC